MCDDLCVLQVDTKKISRKFPTIKSGLEGPGKLGLLHDKNKEKNPIEVKRMQKDVDKIMEKSNVAVMEQHRLVLDKPGLKPPKKTEIETRAQRWFGEN